MKIFTPEKEEDAEKIMQFEEGTDAACELDCIFPKSRSLRPLLSLR